MQLPTYEEHCAFYERNNNIVEISGSAFQRVALEYGNPFAAGVFSVIDNYEPYERIIFVDKDIFASPRPTSPWENFEDIKPFCIEHEMAENYESLKDRIGQTGRVIPGIDVQHDEVARSIHLRRAHEAGLLTKMLEFHIVIQMAVQNRLEKQRGLVPSDKPDAETNRLIQKTLSLARAINQQAPTVS